MAYTISQLKDDLERKLHGTSLSKVQGVVDLINESARTVLQDVDPLETKRLTQITNAVYDDVYIYATPADLKGDKIIDIRKQVNRGESDNFSQTFNEQFDLRKKNNTATIELRDATKFLRLSKASKTGLLLSGFDSITGDGTWAVGSDAEELTADTLNKIAGNSSLRFDLDGSGTAGYLENSTMDDVDLSDHEDVSAIFLWVYIPDTDVMTSVDLRWGSSSTAYWNRTVTTAHTVVFQDGWNLLRFDWDGSTETGSPDSSEVDYMRVTINYDGTATNNFRVDSCMSKLGEIYELLYYSKFLFRSSAGVFQENAALDSDIVNLGTDSYNLLLNQCGLEASQQIQGEDNNFDVKFFGEQYNILLKQYKQRYPSEVMKKKTSYYRI